MTDIKEIHGIANTKRGGMVDSEDDEPVTVTDGPGRVYLKQRAAQYRAVLTPEQAEWLAEALKDAATRCREARADG